MEVLPPDDRAIAEAHLMLGHSHHYGKRFAEAISAYCASRDVIQVRMARLQDATPTKEEASAQAGPTPQAEVTDLSAIVKDIDAKVNDVKEEWKHVQQAASSALEAETQGAGAAAVPPPPANGTAAAAAATSTAAASVSLAFDAPSAAGAAGEAAASSGFAVPSMRGQVNDITSVCPKAFAFKHKHHVATQLAPARNGSAHHTQRHPNNVHFSAPHTQLATNQIPFI